MPISQERMIKLINAARDFEQAFDQAKQLIQKQRLEHPDNEPLQDLHFYISESGLLSHPVDSRLTIEREHHHFRKMHKYNDRMAAKRALKRGKPQRQTDHGISISRPYQELPITRTTAPPQAPPSQRARSFGSIYDEVEALPAFGSSTLSDADKAALEAKADEALQWYAQQPKGPPQAEIVAAAERINSQWQADVDAAARAKLAELNAPKEAFGVEDLLGPTEEDK